MPARFNRSVQMELDAPKLRPVPTLPFPEDEYAAILKAATDVRTNTFIQTMRHSGLRIPDATALAVSALPHNKTRLYQTKTGEHVYVPIPDTVAEALRAAPRKNPQYFFWSGHSKVQAAASVWGKRIAKVFEDAKIKDGHPHRFRDTFGVGLLEKGVSLETVSNLLGHQSIRVTHRHLAVG
jgi:integrase